MPLTLTCRVPPLIVCRAASYHRLQSFWENVAIGAVPTIAVYIDRRAAGHAIAAPRPPAEQVERPAHVDNRRVDAEARWLVRAG